MNTIRLFLFIFALVFSVSSWALDLSSFELTDLQKQLLLKWHDEGKFPDEKLLKFAKSYHDYNTRPQMYIPPHTEADVTLVTNWAEGRAFVFFAKYAGMMFDAARYEQDCPYPALFNFGLATEKAYLKKDVLEKAFRMMDVLGFHYGKSPETFPQFYREWAIKTGFDKYMIDPSDLVVSDNSL